MKRIIGNIITVILVIIILFMSVLLLSHNDHQVSQFGNKTLLIVDEDMLDYKSGSLLIVTKKEAKNIQPGDYIFYYDVNNKTKTVLGLVNDIYDVDFGQYSFTVNNDIIVDETSIIGRANDTKEYKGWGNILSVLESKYGNLFLVVLPAFLLFIYELINFIVEARSRKNG
jgi:hypothetical protein